MSIEDMVIAWPLLAIAGEQNVSALFDLMEDPDIDIDAATLTVLSDLLRALTIDFGEEYTAVRQVADALRTEPSL